VIWLAKSDRCVMHVFQDIACAVATACKHVSILHVSYLCVTMLRR